MWIILEKQKSYTMDCRNKNFLKHWRGHEKFYKITLFENWCNNQLF